MQNLIIRRLGTVEYLNSWQAMRDFTDQRDKDSTDQLWLLQHPPVFTQGQAGKAEHLLNPHEIPVVHTDRGGQVTYHGPGQLMMYALCDLRRLNSGPRQFVTCLEKTVIDFLQAHGCETEIRKEAPGVYVKQRKIASVGLRIRKGCSYHGLALNVAMDLKPFTYINPCGYSGLQMSQVQELLPKMDFEAVLNQIIPYFMQNFGYNHCQFDDSQIIKKGTPYS